MSTESKPVTWIVETEVFPERYQHFAAAVEASGSELIRWQDDWWHSKRFPSLSGPAVFHGSLGNADRIARELDWSPGAFCDTPAFYCSAYAPHFADRWAHTDAKFTTVEGLVANPTQVAGNLATDGRVFVRPDSPLKPFSGRVVSLQRLTPADLDCGFYYDDPSLPIVVAPIRSIAREWRFVVVEQTVVAGSEYIADGRTPTASADTLPMEAAQAIATQARFPSPVFVMDLCETDNEIRLLELNPFSGADLYHCDPHAIVREVNTHVS